MGHYLPTCGKSLRFNFGWHRKAVCVDRVFGNLHKFVKDGPGKSDRSLTVRRRRNTWSAPLQLESFHRDLRGVRSAILVC